MKLKWGDILAFLSMKRVTDIRKKDIKMEKMQWFCQPNARETCDAIGLILLVFPDIR